MGEVGGQKYDIFALYNIWMAPYDLRQYCFSARIINIWNSLPNHVVDVNTINLFKTRLDRFWANQDVKYDFTADLTGTGDRSVYEVYDT